ncbi:MAG: C25 family cysteine peptidase [Bacteroidetes bacterium]|nr:C25 family cysteine peptidase [Bacteroidota bacterium]
MKRFSVALIAIAIGLTGFSQRWTAISSQVPAAAKVQMLSSTIDKSVVSFSLPGFYLNEVTTPQGPAFSIEIRKSTPILESGAPDLPKMTASLVIPDQAGMSYRIVSSTYKDYPNMLIAPSKGVLMRDIDPSTVPYTFGAAYAIDRFYPGSLADTREPYIIRDVRGQTLIAYPFQYNPVSKILRVYYDMTIELYKTGETGINPLPQTRGIKQTAQDFQSLYHHQFLNSGSLTYTPLNEYGNLLVICYGPFMNAMKPYVDWKRAEGYQTKMISKDSVGSTAAQIKAYIVNYYNTKGLTHVLLVGDGPQIPTNTGGTLGGPSDNAYGYIVGNDHYADVFIGRFSAENEAQVLTQVQRTLEYEQNPSFPADDWFTTVIGIGSDQGPGDDNEYDYQHIRNQQTKLLNTTYTMNPELFDGSQGGNDAAGNPTPPLVATSVNNGASLILYTGHGSKTSWGSSGFSNSSVTSLTNAGKLPFIWSVACVNGEFASGTPCFAEAWMRASQGGQPTGAIAFLGSTINQSWDSPMEGQDAMTDLLIESDSTNIKHTFAGISINGCMKMIDSYGGDGSDMADTWTIFGDPTIMVRTAVPQPITALYDTMLYVGDSTLSVYCSVNGARVTATLADSILATGLVVNDTVILSFPALTMALDTIHLVVTAYNKLPSRDILVVHAIPAPVQAGFSGLPTRVIPGQSVAFADTSTGNTTLWIWHFEGGTPSVSYEKNPVVTYEVAGTYDVKLIVGDGFSMDSTLVAEYIVADYPAMTGDKTGTLACSVLPNPSDGNFSLIINSSGTDLVGISVFDMIGMTVYADNNISVTGKISKNINLTSLPDGIYFLKIAGTQLMTTKKLIIKR